jgi:hypothetical protein
VVPKACHQKKWPRGVAYQRDGCARII